MPQKRYAGKVAFTLALLICMLFGMAAAATLTPPKPHPIYGHVLDQYGTPLEDKLVRLVNTNTGESLQTTTAADGSYVFELANLASGYNDGDVLKIQINSQEKTLVVDASAGYQRVEDFIINVGDNPSGTEEEQTLSAPTSTPAPTSAALPMGEKSVPEFPSILIPVAITLLSILFLKRVLVDRK
ncbi:MAG: hypothetical protein DRN91_04940 [Candidatus Alkanophagales archaeon]|nr:MAG: hypothetical protein DRN91_04940 [Candidatus Alkanophagales archaeon]